MKFNDRNDFYTLSTGREFYANHGVIGMGAFKRSEFGIFALCLSEGADGGIDTEDFSTREQLEVANYIIKQWLLYVLYAIWLWVKRSLRPSKRGNEK